MKQYRLEQLADGIFAIVMTLLAIEIKLPANLTSLSTDLEIAESLLTLVSPLLSYLLAFTVLFSYWRSHHFITSVFVHNVDTRFTNINACFLFLIALLPFTSHLLGLYSNSILAIYVFALHIILMGLFILWMRLYAEKSNTIENTKFTKIQHRHAYVRIIFPILSAVAAMCIAPFNQPLALFIFTIGIIFNISSSFTRVAYKFLGLFFPKLK
jgi:uncharacterized membrane protein